MDIDPLSNMYFAHIFLSVVYLLIFMTSFNEQRFLILKKFNFPVFYFIVIVFSVLRNFFLPPNHEDTCLSEESQIKECLAFILRNT